MSSNTDPTGPHEPSLAAIYDARAQGAAGREPWLHPMCQPLALTRQGPLLPLADGGLLTVDTRELAVSRDDGRTWGEALPAAHGQDPTEPASCYLLQTRSGALVMVYLDLRSEQRTFRWDDETGEPGAECWLEMCAVRSLDGGRTWIDRRRLLGGYNANFFGLIQTRGGRLVAVAEHLLSDPGRWAACSLTSDDEGLTWRRSNLIDLGGRGHHDGATEPTVAELSDGRLLMLIRTNLGRFWQALSEDGGRYWRTIQPSAIEASSAPGHLVRLASGRLVLVWNRPHPEDGAWPLVNPAPQHAEFPASWHREELSISFSADDGRTWTEPVAIAKLRGGQLSYPQVVERRPGEVWVVAGFASRRWFNEDPFPFALRLREEELLGAGAKR